MNKKLINFLKKLENSLDGEAQELAGAIQAAIAEAEGAEEVLTKSELETRLKGIMERMNAQENAQEAEIEDKVKSKVATEIMNFKNEFRVKQKNYLETNQATLDFLNTVRTARSGAEQKELWEKKLIENGITDLSAGSIFPVEIEKGVMTMWDEGTGLLGKIKKVSNRTFRIVFSEQAQSHEDVRARGHQKGKLKTEQDVKVQPKQINMQAVYKDLYVDRIDLVNLDDNGAMISWIVEELAMQLTYEIERAILVGDGRLGGNDVITSIESIGTAVVTDSFTTVIAANAAGTSIERIVMAVDSIKNLGKEIWLYTSKATRSAIRKFVYGQGGTPQFRGLEQIKDEIGVAEWKTSEDLPVGVEAILLVPELYYRIGGEPFGETWTMFEYNKEAFRSEIFIGGAIAGLKSTAVVLDT